MQKRQEDYDDLIKLDDFDKLLVTDDKKKIFADLKSKVPFCVLTVG